jgi:hypothetical protein
MTDIIREENHREENHTEEKHMDSIDYNFKSQYEKRRLDKKSFKSLSKEDKTLCISNYLTDICFNKFSFRYIFPLEDIQILALKIAVKPHKNYTHMERAVMRIFHEYYEESINDSEYCIQFIYDVCSIVLYPEQSNDDDE